MSRTAAVRTAMAHLAETSRSDLPSVGPLRFDRLGLPIRDRMGCFDERVRRWLSGP